MALGKSSLGLLVLGCLSLLTSPVSSVSFRIVPDVRKCLREEVHKDVLVIGDYQLSEQSGQKTDIVVCQCNPFTFECRARGVSCSR